MSSMHCSPWALLAVFTILVALSHGCRSAPQPAATRRIAVLSVGFQEIPPEDEGQVVLGWDVLAGDLESMVPSILKLRPDLLLLEVHCTGSALEAAPVALSAHSGFGGLCPTVAWCRTGTGGGMVLAWPATELWLHPDTTLGPATFAVIWGEQGGLPTSNEEAELARRAQLVSRVATSSRRDRHVFAAATTLSALSATVDSKGRALAWSNDEALPVLVQPSGRMLVLAAEQAARFGIVNGLASSPQELLQRKGLADATIVGSELNQQFSTLQAARVNARIELRRIHTLFDEAVFALQHGPEHEHQSRRTQAAARLDEMATLLNRYPSAGMGMNIRPGEVSTALAELRLRVTEE
jgi:hypothetical protein